MSIFRAFLLLGGLTSARLGGAVLGLAIQVLLTRTVTPETVGIVMLGMSIAAFASLLVTAGYPALGATFLARYYALGRLQLVRAFLAAARIDTFILIVLGGAALATALFVTPAVFDLRTAVVFGGIAAVAHALIRLNNVVANSTRRFALSYVPDFVVRPALLLTAIAALAAMPGVYEGWQVLAAFAAITWLVALAQSLLLAREGVLASASAPVRRAMHKRLRPRALSLAVVALFAGAFGEIVTLLSGLLLPLSQVAVVGISIKIAALVGYLPQALQHFALRDYTAARARRDHVEIHQLLLRVNVTCVAVLLAALGGTALLGDFALAQFGEVYRSGYWLLLLLLAGQLIRAGSNMNMHVLSLGGKQTPMAVLCILSAIVLVAVAAFAVPRFGLAGMGIGVLTADLFWAMALAVMARRLDETAADIFAVLAPVFTPIRALRISGTR